MCFRRALVTYLGSNDVEEGLRKFGELVYVKDVVEQIVRELALCSLKMSERSDLQQRVNIFNSIIVDLVRLRVKIGEEDKTIILLRLLPGSD